MKSLLCLLTVAAFLASPAILHAQKTAPKKTDAKPAPKKPEPKKKTPLPFKAMVDNVSYGIGLDFGQRIVQSLMQPLGQSPVDVDRKKLAAALSVKKTLAKSLTERGLEINEAKLKEGFADAVQDAKSKLTDKQLEEVFMIAQKQIVDAREKLVKKTKKEGEDFLAANKKKKGVVTTKSGLQYQVLTAGKGASPKATDTVVTHYRGTLLNGTEFDSSIKRKIPATFKVGQVILGWTEALQLMKKGGKWKLFIPSELAYGERGSRSIGPHSVLIFEVELIDIKASPAVPKKPGAPQKTKGAGR